jgi:uncharacterized membrane protein
MASSPVAGGYVPQRRVSLGVIAPAWALFLADAVTWVVATLIVVAVNVVLGFAVGPLLSTVIPFAGGILAAIPGQILFVGLLRMAFKKLRGERIEVGDLFAISDILVPAAVAAVLTGLGTALGTLFCIVPGVVVAGLWLFTFPLIADRRSLDGIEAMRTSWNTLQGELMMAAVFVLVLVLMTAVGLLLCGVGVLVAGPVAILSLALLYRGYFPDASVPAGPA